VKKLMPEDAKEAVGHGIRAKRSKSGAISFDLRAGMEASMDGQTLLSGSSEAGGCGG
jgi:hypothetical protein